MKVNGIMEILKISRFEFHIRCFVNMAPGKTKKTRNIGMLTGHIGRVRNHQYPSSNKPVNYPHKESADWNIIQKFT